ncbi:hypothetical protein [Breoghania sp.]|uniref:hypothetical protein n=1 Tax=Breoghania sp. TaxID=2065378 RepID=UPI0029C9E9B2|nr:hypothetical protein [Breoghania sp.]
MRQRIILLALILIITIGLIPTLDIYKYFLFEHEIKFNLPYLIITAGLALPPLLVLSGLLVAFTCWRLNRVIAWLLALVVLFGFLSWVMGAAALAAPGATLIWFRALALALSSLALLRLLTSAPSPAPSSRLAWTMIGIAAAISVWSLAGMIWISYSASAIAGDRPYCLAFHSREVKPVRSFSELRYFSFFTTYSGYKRSSHWYFHGVLIVNAKEGRQVYNWSPRRFAWDRVHNPEILLENPVSACDPKAEFMRDLRLY